MSAPDNGRRQETRTYLAGFAAALVLTGAAFALVHWRVGSTTHTFAAVLGLGLAQILVHFRCFLHVSLRRSARDDLLLILFSSLIIALMVGGTLVILFNLRDRMM